MLAIIKKRQFEREKEEKIILISNLYSRISTSLNTLFNELLFIPFNLINKNQYKEFNKLNHIYYLGNLLSQDIEFKNMSIEAHMNHILRFLPINTEKSRIEDINLYICAQIIMYLKKNKSKYDNLIFELINLKNIFDNGINIDIFDLSKMIEMNDLLDNLSI